MTRLYIDLTTSFQEKGRHPHGTTRVERSIVAAFAAMARPDVFFFSYGRPTGCFTIVAPEDALELATAPTFAEKQRELPTPCRRRPFTLVRDIWRRVRPGTRASCGRRSPVPPAAADIFAPGSTLLFAGELHRHDFGQLLTLKRTRRIKLAVVFYDLLRVLDDDDASLADPTASDLPTSDFIARDADLALAISEYSAGELRKHVMRRGLRGPEIVVIRLANRLPSASMQSPGVSGLDPGRFVLTVGDVVLRKNHALLVRVWKRLIAAGVRVPALVIAGRIDREGRDFVLGVRADDELRDRIHFIANADDRALASLYRDARFTVFPSYLEGFGLPVAESLGCGKVCIASSAAAIPEAGQGLAIGLHPDDETGWFETIRTLCENDTALADREKEIARRFRTTTWADTAADIGAAIDAVNRD
jgi:hypothetical protein